MTPDDVTNAIVNAIIIGGRQWVVSTIAAMLPSLWVMTIILHLARPYVFRTIRKLSLRFGADIWWLGYVLVRDGIMLTTFALSMVFLFASLDMTIDLRSYRVSTVLLAIGAAFYLVPQIFAIESADVEWMSGVAKFLTSTSNPSWVGPIVIVAMIGYGVIGGLIFQQVVIRGSR